MKGWLRIGAWMAIAAGCVAFGVACGGASQAPASASGSSAARSEYASGGATAPERSGSEAAVTSDANPPSSPTSAPVRGPAPAVASPGSVGGDGASRMSYWEGRLDRASSMLSSSSECRDICRASGDICVAAHEICGLTGDGENTSPTDSRCSRARTACEQATRQRNGSCPVCPRE